MDEISGSTASICGKDLPQGVYICSGCGIGEAVELEKLTSLPSKEFKIQVCKSHPFLCGSEGVDLIKKDLETGEIKKVIIAACSPRVNTDVFRFDNTPIERVSLRELVAWTHKPKDEDTQMLAEDYLRMGITRSKQTEEIEPWIGKELSKVILVVGGGITGCAAALEAAETGYEVILVEKEPELGGFVKKLYKQYPKTSPYENLQETDLGILIDKVKNHSKIKIYTGTVVESTSGEPGMFEVTLRKGEEEIQHRIGSMILAAGFKPYDANKLTHLGYGSCTNVITNAQMEEMLSNGGSTAGGSVLKRPSDGKTPTSVAFIQCAGSRDADHLPYCSSICCMNSLKQAVYVRESNPDAKVYIIYKDMRTPGQYENFYKKVQADLGVFLTKGEIASITEDQEKAKNLIVEATDTLLGKRIQIKVELVVLATGLVPSTFVPQKVQEETTKAVAPQAYKEETEACSTEGGSTGGNGKDKKEGGGAPREIGAGIINLTYRLGTDLPTLKYGFPDSNFICFPYETQRTGIYAAGTVRQPMDTRACLEDAAGAAMKAIQCVELISIGAAVHPRAGDLSYPEFFLQRCTQCKRCTEECPFGALDEDEKGTPEPHPNRCRRCGVCMGACPERIVSFKDYGVHMISAVLKSIHVPDEFEEKPRVIALICENDAYPALDIAASLRKSFNPFIRIIPIRCLGSVNTVWIADALSAGIDGVMLIGCKYGDDYQCHFIKGSELANRRMENVQEALTRLVLESERVQITQLALTEYEKLPKLFSDFMETIKTIGLNPYKGF